MLYRLFSFTVVARQTAVNKVEKRNLLHPHDFPVPLKSTQIDRSQAWIIAIRNERVQTVKRQFIVPFHDALGWKC